METPRNAAHRPGRRAGALARLLGAVGTVAALACLTAASAVAQVKPDTLRADTTRARLRADSLRLLPDSLRGDAVSVDSMGIPIGLPRDTIQADSVSADTIFYNLPDIPQGPGGGWQGGVWSWDHEAILSTGSLTLVDLVQTVPGVITLRAGDYGTPLGFTAFGLGGGRIRVFRDGFELVPLGGGTVDLSQVGLAGLTRVRLERFPGEIRLYLTSKHFDDGRPYSLVEAGTGDLGTNIIRGTFANPTAMGGDLAVGLERLDSQGARGNEPGFNQGTWLRYQLHRGDKAGLGFDFRRMASKTDAEPYIAQVTRTDFLVRGSAELVEGLTADAYWGRSSRSLDDTRETYLTEGGRRSQIGLRAGYQREGATAEVAWRKFGNEALPGNDLEVSVGGERPEFGGLAASLEREAWEGGVSTSAKRVRAWTRPLLGFSAFGSWEKGSYGARTGPLNDVPLPPDSTATDSTAAASEPATDSVPGPPLFRTTDGKATRYGVQWAWKGIVLSGARLRQEMDSVLPLGLQPDRGEPALAGGVRDGWEAAARLPLPLFDGLWAEGSMQQWRQEWSYQPKRVYQGAIKYHNAFLASKNFELWVSLGVVGHDAMTIRRVVGDLTNDDGDVIGPELAAVPFYQNWYGRIQMKIVTVHVFIGWDNFTVRRDLQDYPERLLPGTRAVYGIRWTMWN